jgi:secretion/DNA translocation related TadE-like protein
VTDDGVASPVLLALLALAALMCVATTDAANVLLSRARAQTAADAAALAAASAQWRAAEDPEVVARDIAEANGAELVACECDRHDDRSIVTVRRATNIRMLGVSPRSVAASAEASLDIGGLFRRR